MVSCSERVKSTTRMQELTKVFPEGSARLSHVQMVRLAVLYEDLRIEVYALREDSFPILDVTDRQYRVNYFLRRAIATLVEYAETVRLLAPRNDFKTLFDSVDALYRKYWDDGLAFFHDKEPLLKSIRNDIGAHFGSEAASYALQNLNAGAVGQIERRGTDQGQTLHLPFAGEIVATAMLRHLPGNTVEEKYREMIQLALRGLHHATLCTQFVVFGFL